MIWARREEVAASISDRRENVDYLPGIELPRNVKGTADPEQALSGADIVILAVPSQSLRSNLPSFVPYLEPDAVLVSLMKGIELGTLERMSEVIQEVADIEPDGSPWSAGPTWPRRSLAVSRPRRSSRVPTRTSRRCCRSAATRRRSGPTPASTSWAASSVAPTRTSSRSASAWPSGSGFGDNTTASLITRGLAETARLAMRLGANPLTLMGLAGLGDLVATCSSPLSRNRTFGEKLGLGMSVDEVIASTRQVAEGAKSCSSIRALAEKAGVEAPIAEHVDEVVAGRMTTAGDDGRLHQPRPQGRDGLGRSASVDTSSRCVAPISTSSIRAARVPGERPSSACARSAHRSSTSSMPTDSRTRPSGMVGGLGLPAPAPLQGRLDPAERGGVHPQPYVVGEQVGGRRAAARPRRHDRAEAGVADLLDRGVLAQPAHQLGGVGLGPVEAHVQGAHPAERQPGLERTGDRADQVAPALERGEHLVVAR